MLDHPVILLSIVTLVAVLGLGLWQWLSVRASQARRGEKPGDVTMTKHEQVGKRVDVHPEPANRAVPAGDVSSFKRQDAEADAAATSAPGKPKVFWGGKPRDAA